MGSVFSPSLMPQRPANILVVDDEELNRLPLVTLLEMEGYGVVEAGDGAEAIGVLACQNVDLVLLDVVMPGMDGFETCRYIRQKLGDLTLPIIFQTGLDDRESKIRGKMVGADDFLAKPVDPVELMARVGNLLKVRAFRDLEKMRLEAVEEELDAVREQLLQADRLASLGTLAGSVGHELQTVVAILNATVDFVTLAAKDGKPPAAEDIENLKNACQHLKTHATQLLHMGRPGPQNDQLLDVRSSIAQTLSMLSATGKTKRVTVTTELPKEAVWVRVNPTRIEQVLINIICNAVDAILGQDQTDGRIRICVEMTASTGEGSCLIENNGPPVHVEFIEKIFSPYFTTKASMGGTGLGLNVVQYIVASWGQTVRVENLRNGGGVAFRFGLPLVAGGNSA
ncbi:MAG: response regulator [Deltaproteobacteria bacterium]|nr:response regulator [Deltaproteobacteria bacterium]